MLKIVITGPESTGKTTLANQLAMHFNTIPVPEFARHYIEGLSRPYNYDDLEKIAKHQIEIEDQQMTMPLPMLICDTDLITIKIWSVIKYGHCSPWIEETIKKRQYDHYLLCEPDLPWEFDEQRENPENRDELFQLYKKEIESLGKSFSIINGIGDVRLEKAIEVVEAWRGNS